MMFILFSAGLGLSTGAQATESLQVSVQAGPQSFRWREFNSAGERLLQETGARFSIGAALDNFKREGSGALYGVNGKIYLAGSITMARLSPAFRA